MDARQQKLISVVAKLPINGGKLLDIGCADGDLSLLLKEVLKAEEVYGLDVVPEYLKEAARKGVKTFKVDVNRDRFPFQENSFDVIIASEILEHCILPENLLREANRILKPGGYLVLSTPNLASFYDRFLLLFGSQPLSLEASHEYPDAGKTLGIAFNSKNRHRKIFEGDPGHIRCMSYKATRELLRRFEFRIKHVDAYNWSHSSVKAHIRFLTFALDRVFSFIPGFAVGYIYTASKKEAK